jgi:CelD/BcsL family acetyltransferase involved in cellulose biosynthesis
VGLTITTRALASADDAWCLGDAWDALLARSVTNVFFLTRLFQRIWWEELGEGRPLVLVGQNDGGAPLFIAPLSIAEVAGQGRTVQLIGGREVADYLDILAAPEDLERAWRLIFEHLRGLAGSWDTLELRALPAWSESRRIVAALADEFGWTAEQSVDNVCPIITLPASWDDYLKLLSKKDRHELRRKIGRLERAAGGERFELIGPDDDLTAATEDFFRLHRLSGQEKEGFWTAALERFFRRLIADSHAAGWLRLSFQSIAGRRAAAVLAFRYGDRYYVYNSGYDPAFRDYAAGVVCMGRTIRAAIDEGVAIFDLLQGDEPYKYRFGAVDTPVFRLLARPTVR